jgi:GTPase-activator protein for Ras-like GTPase
MDGQRYHGSSAAATGGGVGSHNTTPPLDWPPSSTFDRQSQPMERTSSSNLRTSYRTTISGPHGTIRAVTPDMYEREPAASSHKARNNNFTSTSPQSSPRSIPRPGDVARRQGVVFLENANASYDSTSSSPPARQTSGTFRPRTHTMDGALRQQHVVVESRHRVGSFSSAGSQALYDDVRSAPPLPSRPSDSSTGSVRDKKSSTRRLVKRQSSRPTSPQVTTPSVDSLPIPVPTEDANRVLLLMKTLCGRMRGEVEYQTDSAGAWERGVAYVDEERGSLMFDSGHNGPFHVALVVDLRGCRVAPLALPDSRRCLEVISALPNQTPVELLLHPLVAEERDLWLAALLCWQQLRPPKVKLSNGNKATTPTTAVRPPLRTRSSDNGCVKPNLIKVGQVRLWDKGLASSPRAIVKRPSTRDLRSPSTSWRLVSCLLQENGEMRLTTTDGDAVIAVVELSQLSRCAIQQLDKSVLDDEHCIAIFPHYSPLSTQLSIFRPVYIALDTRLLFEVWFVLLRAFALPDIYRLDPPETGRVSEILDLEADLPGDIFRVEKTLNVRVTEAKLRPKLGSSTDNGSFVDNRSDRSSKNDNDPLIGNYFAEVILDGEVRARTPIKTGTRNPYWREEYQYQDLPPAMPFLSVILKRVDGNLDIYHPMLQASTNVSKFSNLSETLCGAVDIALDQIERGKDTERWLEIYGEHQQVIGTMLVKVLHEELVVLHSREYAQLSTLLHSFPSGLTTQIAGALPGHLRKLSEIFLNIFQVSGQAIEWLQTLVEDEIDGVGSQSQMKQLRFSSRLKSNESLEASGDRKHFVRETGRSLAGEANLLFRGNTLLTQALEFHMRRAGKEYLENMLAAKINEINEMNPNCEVDPSKLKPGENLQQNWDRLLQMATEIWQCIAKEPTKCPPELRSILKYVRAVAEDRYGDWLRTVVYTSVSSFLFLRFICPAILSPKLFGLLPDHPRPRAQRTFTLIAKALQALGNLTTFGKKEDWMEPMNKFLNAQRQSIRDYIDAICAIPVDRNRAALGPSYSTPMTILGRLSPNAREGFPALPHVIDHARNFAALVKLWTQVNPLANADPPHALSGVDGGDDVLIFNEMCLGLQHRTETCHAKFEGYRTPDSASPSVSDLAEVLERSSILDSINVAYGTPGMRVSSPEMYASPQVDNNLQPPGSAGSDFLPEPAVSSRRSREHRRGREVSTSTRHASGQADASTPGSGGTLKRHNGGGRSRNILSGIMKPFARSDSPEGSSPMSRTGKSLERHRNHGA